MTNTDIIKDKLNILDVVGSYVKLEKAGKTYKGKSPFTHEKTPSFFVSPEKGFFYCFSSGKGGDIFNFIQEIERVEFPEALKILAEKAGVTLEKTANPEHLNKTKLLFKIIDDATKWYEINLRKNPDVVDHLIKRGLTKETIIKFRLGFAKDSWQNIYDYLRSRKYTDADIAAVGLITKKEGGGYYDRFRSRIMFPLMDGRGRVVGFSGRIFSDDPDIKGAKYINSPEGPLFDKSKVLYGYHSAKSEISKQDSCILVEGQFDVLLAQQAGFINTVAISGTGLTDEHINMIKRFADTVYLALDSDKAGIKATRRSVIAAYRHGLGVKIIVLPEGMDPADTISRSVEIWSVAVTDSRDYLDYRIEVFMRQDRDFSEKKKLVDEDLFTFVALTKSAMIQDRMLQKIALFLGVSIEAVRADFIQFSPQQDDFESADSQVLEEKILPTETPRSQSVQNEILFLEAFVQEKNIERSPQDLEKQSEIYRELYGSDLTNDKDALDDTMKNMRIFALERQYKDSTENILATVVLQSLEAQYKRKIDQDSQILLEKIRQAESQSDYPLIKRLMQEHQNLLLLKK